MLSKFMDFLSKNKIKPIEKSENGLDELEAEFEDFEELEGFYEEEDFFEDPGFVGKWKQSTYKETKFIHPPSIS